MPLFPCMAYFSTLKMEAAGSSEMLVYIQCQIYSCEDPGAIEVRRSLSVTTTFSLWEFVLISSSNLKYKQTFSDFKEANVSVKSVHSVSVLWRPQGNRLGHSPLNRTL
jgi:hypothetical protein